MTALPCAPSHHGPLGASKDPQMDSTWIPRGSNCLTSWTSVASENLQQISASFIESCGLSKKQQMHHLQILIRFRMF
jgi:hypothetical protein